MNIEQPDVTVKVSKELLAQMGDWSEPVQVKIEQLSNGEYNMIARSLGDTDRNARAYGWEVGRGAPMEASIESSPDNPFLPEAADDERLSA